MPDFKDISIANLLPSSLQVDDRVAAVAEAANEQLQCIDVQRQLLHILANMDWSDEDIIELLAWQWHIDFWDDQLTLTGKRELVKNSIPWHRRKGTPAVVEEMARVILASANVTEWFEYGGKPYFFRIECSDLIQDTITYDRVIELIGVVKNVRSWLEAIRVYRTRTMNLYFGGAQRRKVTMTIYPKLAGDMENENHLYLGEIKQITKFMKIYPQEAIV